MNESVSAIEAKGAGPKADDAEEDAEVRSASDCS